MAIDTNTIDDSMAVSFKLDINTVIGEEVAYDEEGDRVGTQNVTLGDRIAQLVAKQIATKIDYDLRNSYGFNPVEIAEKALDERVVGLLDEALEKIVVPTNEFGEPKGEPRTVASLMHERIKAWFASPADKRDTYNRKTNLQAYMDSAVDHRMKQAMDAAVAEAKKSIVTKMQQHAQSLMADAVVKITGGK